MTKADTTPTTTIATLTMIVKYEDLPDMEELDSLIERAREMGAVQSAKFTVHRAVTKELA